MTTFVSAATSQDGTKIVLTYNEALSSIIAPTSAFTVTSGLQGNDVNTVSEATVSGSTVELTVSNNIKNDETVRVSYTDPTGGNDQAAIQNSAGVDAASLGITAVTNNSTMPGNSPVYVGSTTSTDGTKIILTYNKALSSTTAAVSAFTVTTGGSANAVTNVAVSGSTVELTLTTTVKNDDYITVAYADPTGGNDANAIQDTVGNDVNHLASTMVVARLFTSLPTASWIAFASLPPVGSA